MKVQNKATVSITPAEAGRRAFSLNMQDDGDEAEDKNDHQEKDQDKEEHDDDEAEDDEDDEEEEEEEMSNWNNNQNGEEDLMSEPFSSPPVVWRGDMRGSLQSSLRASLHLQDQESKDPYILLYLMHHYVYTTNYNLVSNHH